MVVGGDTADNVDFIDAMNRWLPFVFAFVLGLSFVLLTVVFRSIVIAGTSIVLNLLSVGAAYGLVILVFRHGIGSGLFGFQRVSAIEAWVPLFLFSVLFGLSMDYQVFLLSRIKERYDATGSTTDAVTHGVASTARLITGAALIIVAVFSGFARGDLVMFQQMGFGVAVALLIDATIIRSVLLPAAMRLLGRLELVPAAAGSSGCRGSRSRRIARSMYRCQARGAEWTCAPPRPFLFMRGQRSGSPVASEPARAATARAAPVEKGEKRGRARMRMLRVSILTVAATVCAAVLAGGSEPEINPSRTPAWPGSERPRLAADSISSTVRTRSSSASRRVAAQTRSSTATTRSRTTSPTSWSIPPRLAT